MHKSHTWYLPPFFLHSHCVVGTSKHYSEATEGCSVTDVDLLIRDPAPKRPYTSM